MSPSVAGRLLRVGAMAMMECFMSSDNFYQRHTGPQKRRRSRALVIDGANQPPRAVVNADNKPSELARKSLKRFAIVVGCMVALMYVSVKLIEISWRRSDMERLQQQDAGVDEAAMAPAVLSKPLPTPTAIAAGESTASPETTNQAATLLSRVDPAAIAANRERADQEFRWGKILEEAGEFEGALARYEAALAMNQQDPLLLSQAGRLYIRQGRHAEAIPLLVRARDLIPDNPDIINDLGVALTFNGQAADAVTLYGKLAASHPDYAPAGFNHGYALVQLNEYEKARPLLEAFLDYEPENAMAIGVLAMLELADEQPDRALELLDRDRGRPGLGHPLPRCRRYLRGPHGKRARPRLPREGPGGGATRGGVPAVPIPRLSRDSHYRRGYSF
jgi:tetratricopeptide (TPR) repeat protein